MTATVETRRFEAEVEELLHLVIHSLYTQKEIFLRELISNASDALDKRRLEGLRTPGAGVDPDGLWIRVVPDPKARTLTVADNGVGMSREELVSNLGTIARSGTRAFVERLKASREEAAGLIGQFGVGFYSAFMVAHTVVVESRPHDAPRGARWTSSAKGEYTIEEVEGLEPGTRVILHLKDPAPAPDGGAGDEGAPEADFTAPFVLRQVIKRHSDFVEWPIYLEPAGEAPAGPREPVNSRRPLWTRPKDEIRPDEHAEFYRQVAHAFDEPALTLHLKADVPVEYTALLYAPTERPLDWGYEPRVRSRLALYVRRVLIMPECEDLLPPWLRFVRGVVECPDLPLNVSRQTLQANPLTRRIRKHLVGKVLGGLKGLLEKDREAYARFYASFGAVLKEGIAVGEDEEERLARLLLFASTTQQNPTTLAEYVERMATGQEAIYVLSGRDERAAAQAPHLEAYVRRGLEVLLLTDPIDDWVLQRLVTFAGKPLRRIDQAGVEPGAGDAPAEAPGTPAPGEAHKDLLEALGQRLGPHVEAVRLSTRLEHSPALLVTAEGAPGPAMERMLRESQGMKDLPPIRRTLELNPGHPLFRRLVEAYGADPQGARFDDLAHVLLGQAYLREGIAPADPVDFARRLERLL